jgi:ATP-dependent protease ClpP protease subunit
MESSFFSENPKRAIYVLHAIDRELLANLIPAITELRAGAPSPITVYLDSPGGSTYYADSLLNLLRAPNQKNDSCKLTTVVTTYAASAAADILVSGDYAIAYPKAIIHCHGVWQSSDSITVEKAQEMAGALQQANNQFALRLAGRVVGRLLFIYTATRANISKEKTLELEKTPVDGLISMIESALDVESNKLVVSAYKHYNETKKSVSELFDIPDELSEIELQKRFLHKIIKHEAEQNKDKANWSLLKQGLVSLREHTSQVYDYLTGEHMDSLSKHVDEYAEMLLSEEECKEYDNIRRQDVTASKKWLAKTAEPRMRDFWYFVICLCRELQKGENRLTAENAYWLGLVDEVIGTNLPCLRLLERPKTDENKSNPPPTTTQTQN